MKLKPTVVGKLLKLHLCTDLEADDVAMVAITRACRNEAKVDGSPAKIWSWVWRTARNYAFDLHRQSQTKRRKAEFESVDMEMDPRLVCSGPQTAHARRCAAGWLRQAIAKLEPHEQECVRLKHEEGLSIAAIVRQTGLPRHKVKAALLKAGRKLRAELDDAYRLMMEASAEGH